jgi:ABC-2 type transport system permease protein
MITIFRKELADYFTSIRFPILFIFVLLASAVGLYSAWQGIHEAATETDFVFLALFTTSGEGEYMLSLVGFIALIVPIIGIALGFDAINSERSSGTLNRILSQPVYRDSVINGKLLAGIVILAIMVLATVLIVSGYGLKMIGVTPSAEEIIRLFIYLVFTIIYGAFWMGLAILFSVLFRSLAISLLFPLAIWILLGLPLYNPYIKNILPAMIKSPTTFITLARISPYVLFDEAYNVMLIPIWRGYGLLTSADTAYMILNPLSIDQSLLLIWPQITVLIGLAAICFAISYVVFMRQEIRST